MSNLLAPKLSSNRELRRILAKHTISLLKHRRQSRTRLPVADGLAYHNLQLMLQATHELNLLNNLEPQLAVNNGVDRVAALQVAGSALEVGHGRHILDEFACVALAARGHLGAEVHEIPGVVVTGAHDLMLGVVQEGEELVEEAGFAFAREFVVKAPETTAEDGQVVVHVLAGWHPVMKRSATEFMRYPENLQTYHKATHP